jgi:hypothetical protein
VGIKQILGLGRIDICSPTNDHILFVGTYFPRQGDNRIPDW